MQNDASKNVKEAMQEVLVMGTDALPVKKGHPGAVKSSLSGTAAQRPALWGDSDARPALEMELCSNVLSSLPGIKRGQAASLAEAVLLVREIGRIFRNSLIFCLIVPHTLPTS